MARTIQSPGVEIKEVDLSLRPALPVGTNVFVAGFSHQGPLDELLTVASLGEFEQIYGTPRNAAERYFYHTCKQVLNSPANLTVTRLGYGSGDGGGVLGEKFSAQCFPVYPMPSIASLSDRAATAAMGADLSDALTVAASAALVAGEVTTNGWDLSASDGYFFGAPSNVELTDAQYRQLQSNSITYNSTAGDTDTFATFADLKKAGLIVVNNKRFITNEKFEGYYVGIADNTNLNPATDFDAHRGINSLNKSSAANVAPGSYVSVPTTRTTFDMTATAEGAQGSVSEVVENIPTFDINKKEFDDTLILSVFKVRQSTLEPDTTKLDYSLAEGTIGSLNFFREQYPAQGGSPTSFFLESETDGSSFAKVIVNPGISKGGGNWVDENNDSERIVRVLSNKATSNEEAYLNTTEMAATSAFVTELKADITGTAIEQADNLFVHGSFKEAKADSPIVGAIPGKLERVFELADNFDLYPIDLTLEAGLGTVFVGSSGGTIAFDDECTVDISELHVTKTIDDPGDVLERFRNIKMHLLPSLNLREKITYSSLIHYVTSSLLVKIRKL